MKINIIKKTATLAIVSGMAVIGALTFTGCASTGNNFNMERTEQIRPGVTTKADLVKWFGNPNTTSRKADGTQVLNWTYSEARIKGTSFIPYAGAFLGGHDTAGKSLTVYLKNGVVSDYEVSGSEFESRSNRTGDEGGSN